MHANLGKIDKKLKKRLVKEKKILFEDPNLILKKLLASHQVIIFTF